MRTATSMAECTGVLSPPQRIARTTSLCGINAYVGACEKAAFGDVDRLQLIRHRGDGVVVDHGTKRGDGFHNVLG